MIAINVKRTLGEVQLDVDIQLPAKGLTALFGSSGSGKTSVINIVSGLMNPDSGFMALNGKTLYDSAKGINLPTHERRVGYVFQESLLFPHLSVKSNLRYGYLENRQIRMDEITELLGIRHLLERRPHRLSGGEKQRVAIGRALLTNPDLLLMDEPLSALDEKRKDEILPYIERVRDEFFIPIIYVTHSTDELVRLADTVVLMSNGKVTEWGAKDEILAQSPPMSQRSIVSEFAHVS